MAKRWDAVVVGAGPNGLAAAVELATSGLSTLVLEARDTIGGGCRSEELTRPGFLHDVCSAIHPLAAASPVFTRLGLHEHGLAWTTPPAAVAHPLDDQPAVLLTRSVDETAGHLGPDAKAYRELMGRWTRAIDHALLSLVHPAHALRHPVALARLALEAAGSATGLVTSRFRGARARALLGGIGAHSVLPLERPPSAGFALALGALGHTTGWPVARRGSQRIVDALASLLHDAGGEVRTGFEVRSMGDLPPQRAAVFDVTPRQLLRIDGLRFPPRYERALRRYRYGPGVFKVDYALDGPVPWKDPACSLAGTVHVGGAVAEIARAERAVWRGKHPDTPFVLAAQQTLFDPDRAPPGKHTLWAYTHVPNGSTADVSEAMERQIERFAPGFRDLVIDRHTRTAADVERDNANNVGGDINGGVLDLGQLWARPALRLSPHTTPVPGVFVGSASTPPGGGVHGLCGHLAARAALRGLARN